MFKCRFSESTSENVLFISRHSYIRTLSPYAVLTQLPVLRVIGGHMRSNLFLPLTSDGIEIEHWGWSQCVSLAYRYASTDMQCHLLVATRDLTWPWPEVKFRHWHFKFNIYLLRRVSTRGTRCCQSYVTSFLSSKVICEKPFCKKTLFWPSLTFLT